MFKWFSNLFKEKKFEYVYVYILSSHELSKQGISQEITGYINNDLRIYNKAIYDIQISMANDNYNQIVIVFSDKAKNIYFIPIIYEIYAFVKKDFDSSVFSYEYETLKKELFLDKDKTEKIDLPILKFKIQVG